MIIRKSWNFSRSILASKLQRFWKGFANGQKLVVAGASKNPFALLQAWSQSKIAATGKGAVALSSQEIGRGFIFTSKNFLNNSIQYKKVIYQMQNWERDFLNIWKWMLTMLVFKEQGMERR